ncbi:hypothetical protein pb186bvf_012796 [Paramecium bursaria]
MTDIMIKICLMLNMSNVNINLLQLTNNPHGFQLGNDVIPKRQSQAKKPIKLDRDNATQAQQQKLSNFAYIIGRYQTITRNKKAVSFENFECLILSIIFPPKNRVMTKIFEKF